MADTSMAADLGRLRIEVHPNNEATFRVTRASSSDCIWLDVIAGRSELTIFIDADKALAIAQALTAHAEAALAIRKMIQGLGK